MQDCVGGRCTAQLTFALLAACLAARLPSCLVAYLPCP